MNPWLIDETHKLFNIFQKDIVKPFKKCKLFVHVTIYFNKERSISTKQAVDSVHNCVFSI